MRTRKKNAWLLLAVMSEEQSWQDSAYQGTVDKSMEKGCSNVPSCEGSEEPSWTEHTRRKRLW